MQSEVQEKGLVYCGITLLYTAKTCHLNWFNKTLIGQKKENLKKKGKSRVLKKSPNVTH